MYDRHLVISSADKVLEARYRSVKLMLNATARSAKVREFKLFKTANANRPQAANLKKSMASMRRTSRFA